jgi:hypothetical protein
MFIIDTADVDFTAKYIAERHKLTYILKLEKGK